MRDFDEVMRYITNKLLSNFAIAVMAIVLWIIQSETITNDTIGLIMDELEFSFDTSTAVLTVGENTYTVYQMIEYSILNLYRKEKSVNDVSMSISVKFAFENGYINDTEKNALNSLINIAEGAVR